jgi:transcriptional regulator with XRE-family HTH domain
MNYALADIGEVIRRVRKEKGMKLEDLADDNISTATVSNIERGVPHVSTDKTMYLLKKLNIPLESIPQMLMGIQDEVKNIEFKFTGVESLFSNGRWEKDLTSSSLWI